ncbi:Amino acid permease-associated region OS=Tsukamurella paurometabola (strain ATCC 8368 / DSM/ CCUG 35730 / CIP 100753 / JCM 10117 / KCTC 9821 / NBRC 16120/ NCIMB 702349 / NCTC 13040) OX=521096 GN=Tpau_1416 PE=4 SV=1 [Tsukamurella paurometabola]|uniref:Amino acid permease-associated region n=1 Tax=Tsukamurella paurometabola (strain ATCC 8368 / DSM 20162 / CCUG 35730 / CIP 100753 / JCM 10117 / KCTC 9821 / NBRC 16120 / NCIMB 702349 / NCTC 13040) TaxID=521096 RepID=D5UXF2_TSUPD|nr:amino acid permease [Tsukamurella paurometabola]ADG78044.1 amino acid permease-associated region [Tsukamurella paurometabola DSM 20162]SUP29920.1 Putrescine importer PuuP [Tsukamurella paurometabola]
MTMFDALIARKPVDRILIDSAAEHGDGPTLKRSMGLGHLTALSIGASLGTGIFVILGEATPEAGPAVIVAFILAAVTALFSALSYAELAGTIPVSGSSYSYAYATIGEFFAWVCGWCLLLEYGVSIAAVAVGWGQYINELSRTLFDVELPTALTAPPGDGGVVNIPAMVIVALACVILMGGATESARLNTAMVILKVCVLVFFCAIAFTAFKSSNLSPFMPFGVGGMTAAAAMVFFSYIGFDAASTAGNEAKNPRRDLPRAIILSLAIITVLYCLVALAAVGAMPWQEFGGTEASLAKVLTDVTQSTWPAVVLSIGAVVAIASVVLAVMYGQTRILYTMGKDGLVPSVFAKVNARTRVPVRNILIVGTIVALLAGLVPLGELANATSIGSLFAFALVNIGVIVLRNTRPDLDRTFTTPLTIRFQYDGRTVYLPLVPVLGVVFCTLLMFQMKAPTWIAFALWTMLGLGVYFAYGYRNSRMRDSENAA